MGMPVQRRRICCTDIADSVIKSTKIIVAHNAYRFLLIKCPHREDDIKDDNKKDRVDLRSLRTFLSNL